MNEKQFVEASIELLNEVNNSFKRLDENFKVMSKKVAESLDRIRAVRLK